MKVVEEDGRPRPDERRFDANKPSSRQTRFAATLMRRGLHVRTRASVFQFNMKLFLILALIVLTAFHANAQTAAIAVAKPVESAAELRLESFNKVWNTVNEKHYDSTFGGVDWNKIRSAYESKAIAAKTDNEFHGVLRQMLGELKLSHFGILPPAAEIAAAQSGRGVVGIEIKWIDGIPLIGRVETDSLAAAAGIKTGFIVSKIDGKTAAELTKPLELSLAARKVTDGMRKIYLERTIEGIINGTSGTAVKIELLDANDRRQIFNLIRQSFSGQMSQAMGNFPPQEVVFESRMLPDNIGYIRFNMWVIPQMPKLRAAIREFFPAIGIIIDLRGNPGGVGGMASGVAGLMMDKQASLGSMKMRGGVNEFIVYPQSEPFAGKVVILTDHGSGSTSEVFAAGMQELGRATIVGTTTAGAVLPSVFEKLPTPALFQYAIADYRSPKNILIEGRGVIPDIESKQTRKSLLSGGDAQLEAAVKSILK